jgi:DNA-binding NarL/FixJ family response regulator
MTTPRLDNLNLKVVIMDTDYYALQAINSYLAWDRRTRVTHLANTTADMWTNIRKTPLAEQPDVVVIGIDLLGGSQALADIIQRLHQAVKNVKVLCIAQTVDPAMVEAAADAGAFGFLLKQEVRLQIAWAICYGLFHDFIVTPGVAKACADAEVFNTRIFHATHLPDQREYPELTDRIRQAIQLCVVEGMPAHLAAHEMGISLHTIRGYIKEGYRIMEAYDETKYPDDMTPQERAFMRFTAFEEDEDDSETKLTP